MPRRQPPSDRLGTLTPRERECLDLAAQHWRTKDIARQLGLSPATVDEHLRAAMRKLGAPDRATAARVWLGYEAPPAGPPPPPPPDDPWSPQALMGGGVAAAARWSLLAGGAVASVVLLLATASESGALVSPAAAAVARLLAILDWPVVLAGCLLIVWRAGLPERLAAAAMISALGLSSGIDLGAGPTPAVAAVDLSLGAALAAVGSGFRRPWLQLCAASILMLSLTHFAFSARGGYSLEAYFLVLNLWAYAAFAALVWSAVSRRPTEG